MSFCLIWHIIYKAVPRAGGAEAAGAVYIGDSDVDIQTARNAGLPCISVSWGFRSRDFLAQHGAQCIADTPAELQALLTGGD